MEKAYKNLQYYKFCMYGFFKNLRFFEPFFMLFFIEKGISFIQIGALYAIREVSILILELPTGVIADILGRRKTMIVSFLSYITSFVIFYFSSQYFWLTIGMFAFSIGDAMRTGTHKAMIFDYIKLNNWQKHKVSYYGHTRSWSQIGSALSSLIAAAIVIITGNYQQIFLFSTLPYIADLILIVSYPEFLDGNLKKEIPGIKKRLIQYRAHIAENFKAGETWHIFVNTASYNGLFKASKDYLQPLILLSLYGALNLSESKTQSSLLIGVVYFIVYLFSSFISRYSGSISKQFTSLQKALNASLLIGIIALMLSGVLTKLNINSFAIIIFVLIFALQNFRKPVGSALVAQAVDNNILATGLSIQSLFDAVFTSIIAITLGFIADIYSIEKALIITGIALLSIFPVLRIKGN